MPAMPEETGKDTKTQERPASEKEKSALIPYGIVKTSVKGKEVDKLLDTHQR
jgi:hypothetical protein